MKFVAQVACSGSWPGRTNPTPNLHRLRPLARQAPPALDLEEGPLRAEADFERGDFIELSHEELDNCIQTGESPWPGRVPRLNATFRRTLSAIGIEPKSPAYRAVFAAVAALSNAEQLPGVADDKTRFSPTKAYVRRVTGHNVWLPYRFDAEHVPAHDARGTANTD